MTGMLARYEKAESAFGLPRSTGASGYTGTGFADFSDRVSDRLTFWPAGNGDYDLEFRYANGASASRPLLLRHCCNVPASSSMKTGIAVSGSSTRHCSSITNMAVGAMS